MNNNNGDQQMPFSEDSEKALVCSLIHAPGEVARRCGMRLTSRAFYLPACAILFDVIHEWQQPDVVVDHVWLKNTLIQRGLLEEAGGWEAVCHIYNVVPTPANSEYYINTVLERYRRRLGIQFSNAISERFYDQLDEIDPSTLPDLEREFSNILHCTNGISTLKGASLLDYSQRQISHEDTLLGNRYLCRGGGMFIFAPSGIGKSVLGVQAAIEFAIGRMSFGIKPPRPLRSLIIQAEDDEGDTIEMARIVDHLKLTQTERELVQENTWIEFVNDLTGKYFIEALDRFLQRRPSDLVWINPYSSYLGSDIKDDKANALFLRNLLNPVLTKHRCAAVIIAHTPKTNHRDTTEWKPSDWMYAGAGAAVLTNWARAIMVVDPTKTPGVFKFIAAKRGQRLGWKEGERFFAHSNDKILWLPATPTEIAAVGKAAKTTPADLLALIPELDPISQESLIDLACKIPMGRDKTKEFVNILIDEGKIFPWKLPRPGRKPGVGYAKRKDPSTPV